MTQETFSFRLYVTGDAPNSARAITNLAELCRRHLPERHQIEIVDLALEPQRAMADRVFVTPTLIKRSPGAEQRFMGTLSDWAPVLARLGLAAT